MNNNKTGFNKLFIFFGTLTSITTLLISLYFAFIIVLIPSSWVNVVEFKFDNDLGVATILGGKEYSVGDTMQINYSYKKNLPLFTITTIYIEIDGVSTPIPINTNETNFPVTESYKEVITSILIPVTIPKGCNMAIIHLQFQYLWQQLRRIPYDVYTEKFKVCN